MDYSKARKIAMKLLKALPFMFLASTPASATLLGGAIILAIISFIVYNIWRLIYVSKYVLMFIILLNPCIIGGTPCGSKHCCQYAVGKWTLNVPEDEVVRSLNGGLMGLFQGFYIVMILYHLTYLILMSSSPGGRAKSKAMLMTLIVGMVMVSQSRALLQLSLDVSNGIAYSVIDVANQRMDQLDSPSSMARVDLCLMNLCFMSLGLVAIIAAGMRYFFVLIMAAFFPLAIFMYFIPFTKNYGIILIRFTMLMILIQIIQGIIFSVGIISSVEETGLMGMIMAIGSVFGVVYAPLFGMKLMSWLGAVTHFYSTRAGGAGTRFVSLLMRGTPVGSAFTTAGSQYMISHNMGPYMRGPGQAPGGMTASILPPGEGAPHETGPMGYGLKGRRFPIGGGGVVEAHDGSSLGGASTPDGGYQVPNAMDARTKMRGGTISQGGIVSEVSRRLAARIPSPSKGGPGVSGGGIGGSPLAVSGTSGAGERIGAAGGARKAAETGAAGAAKAGAAGGMQLPAQTVGGTPAGPGAIGAGLQPPGAIRETGPRTSEVKEVFKVEPGKAKPPGKEKQEIVTKPEGGKAEGAGAKKRSDHLESLLKQEAEIPQKLKEAGSKPPSGGKTPKAPEKTETEKPGAKAEPTKEPPKSPEEVKALYQQIDDEIKRRESKGESVDLTAKKNFEEAGGLMKGDNFSGANEKLRNAKGRLNI